MSDEALQKLKFPIGKFQKPAEINQNIISLWINDIELFPLKLEEAVKGITKDESNLVYRPDGWNIKQVVNHCADSHMNAIIRFKLALTEDSPTIKPYYEDRWAELADGKIEDISVSLSILKGLHHRWVVLLKNMSESDLKRTFTHPEHGRKISLDENIGLYAWHCNHHLAHVKNALLFNNQF